MRFKKLTLPSTVMEKPSDGGLNQWILYYIQREILGAGSKHTERAKIRDLGLFLGFVENRLPEPDIKYWTRGITGEFINKAAQIYAPSTVNRMLATLSGFAQFLEKSGAIKYEENPVRKIKGPKKDPLQPQGIRVENYHTGEIIETGEPVFEKMIQTIMKHKNKFSLRNATILILLYYTGMRVDELINLKFSQLDMNPNGNGGWIRNVKCKGNKIRDIFINNKAKSWLIKYINSLKDSKNRTYIFSSKTGKKLSQSDIWRIVNKVAVQTARQLYPQNTVIKVHPHSFRHERAYNLLRKTKMGDSFVAEQLGHSSTNYIARYTRRTEDEVAEILKDV